MKDCRSLELQFNLPDNLTAFIIYLHVNKDRVTSYPRLTMNARRKDDLLSRLLVKEV